MSGSLHLIPVGLSDITPSTWLPADVQALAASLDTYIAENAKSARAFLKLIGVRRPLQEVTIYTLGTRTTDADIEAWLRPLCSGGAIGLVSEAGCPAVADPGARVVRAAHAMGITVKPWVGPSSIILGLMASGLDGQRFAFHGYPPVHENERARQLKAWEAMSAQQQQTQIMIETPYRNRALFDALLRHLRNDTQLCVASALTAQHEWIRTHSISRWKQLPPPEFDRQPTLFLYQAQGK